MKSSGCSTQRCPGHLPTSWLGPLTSSDSICTDSGEPWNHLYFLVVLWECEHWRVLGLSRAFLSLATHRMAPHDAAPLGQPKVSGSRMQGQNLGHCHLHTLVCVCWLLLAPSVCPSGLESSDPCTQATSEPHPHPSLISLWSLLLFTRCLPPLCHSELLGCSGTAPQIPPALSSDYEKKQRKESKQWLRAPGRKSGDREA